MWVVDRGEYRGQVSAWDRGAQFGDGVFETILVLNGLPQNFEMHVDRLEKSFTSLSINNEVDIECYISTTLADLLSYSGLHSGVLKVLVSRGDSARGYAVPEGLTPNITLFYSPLPILDETLYRDGVDLKTCNTQCSINPQMSGMKHLNRLENILAKQELGDEYEGLMHNYLGYVVEGTMSNIFFEKDNVLYTPKLDLSGVEGVMRRSILEICQENNLDVQVVDIKLAEVDVFNSAFICNSIIGVLPVNKIDKNKLSIGVVTKQLQALANKRSNSE
jgi:4-amino-4-deoxychorismate lyase